MTARSQHRGSILILYVNQQISFTFQVPRIQRILLEWLVQEGCSEHGNTNRETGNTYKISLVFMTEDFLGELNESGLFLCLINHYTIKMYWGLNVYLHAFSNLTLDGGELSASEPPVPMGQEAGWAPEPVWTLLPLLGKEARLLGRLTRCLVTVVTELSWLRG
jgi:hypothetical protein